MLVLNLTTMLSHSATPQAICKIHLNFENGILHKHGRDASQTREILWRRLIYAHFIQINTSSMLELIILLIPLN